MAGPRILDEAADELVAAADYLDKERPGHAQVFLVALAADGPTIVAVAHTSREPGYWRDRVAPAE